jgi:hypothetical protein
MSGKRKTLSRYKKNKNDTTKKKRTKRSDSRFKRSSNKAINKQIGGTQSSISDNQGRINEILDYLYNAEEGKGQYYADKLRQSLGPIDLMKIYKDKEYISLSDIGNKLTRILMPRYHIKYGIPLGSTDELELKEIGLIVNALLLKMNANKININGFPYVERNDLLKKLRSDPRPGSPQDTGARVAGTGDDGADTTEEDKESARGARPNVLSKEREQSSGLYHFGIVHSEASHGRYVSFSVPHRVPGYIPNEYILYLKGDETIEQFVRGTYGLDWRLGNVKKLFLVNVDEKTYPTAELKSSSDNSIIDEFLKGKIIDENGIENIPGVKKLVWGPGDKLQTIIEKLTDNSFIIVIKDHIRESIDESYELETGSRSESELESDGVSGYLVLDESESSSGENTEWPPGVSDNDKQQFTMMVRLCDLRTGEQTDPFELFQKIGQADRGIRISEITDEMIINYSRAGSGAGSDTGSGTGAEEEGIPGIIDKLKARSDTDEYRNLYEELKFFHELLEKYPELIDSQLATYENYIREDGITELERVDYNTKVTVLKFLKSYLDRPATRNDQLMREIFLDDYRYVFLMN